MFAYHYSMHYGTLLIWCQKSSFKGYHRLRAKQEVEIDPYHLNFRNKESLIPPLIVKSLLLIDISQSGKFILT